MSMTDRSECKDMSNEETSESKELIKIEKLTPNLREVNVVVEADTAKEEVTSEEEDTKPKAFK